MSESIEYSEYAEDDVYVITVQDIENILFYDWHLQRYCANIRQSNIWHSETNAKCALEDVPIYQGMKYKIPKVCRVRREVSYKLIQE